MVRTTLLVSRPGWETHSLHDLSAPGQNTAAGARAPERMTSWGPCIVCDMFVVHTGFVVENRRGRARQEHGEKKEQKKAQGRAAEAAGLPALPARLPAGRFLLARTHALQPASLHFRPVPVS